MLGNPLPATYFELIESILIEVGLGSLPIGWLTAWAGFRSGRAFFIPNPGMHSLIILSELGVIQLP